jgi:zinc protease
MRALRFLNLLLVLLLLAGAAAARELPRYHDQWPHERSDLQPDAQVVWGRLNNGFRYVLLPNATPKDRVSLRLHVAAGALMEAPDQRGLAHFLEHMAFKGSRNLPAGDLVQYLERLGMAFGADTNARTGFESTVYQLELPANDAGLLERSLMVLRETADRLLIPEAEVERERGVVLSEKRMRDTASFRSMQSNLEFLFPGSLVAHRMPIGLESVISTAPRARLVDFYRKWYVPARLTLIVVGAVEPQALAGLVRARFGDLEAAGADPANPDLGPLRRRGLETRVNYDPEGRCAVALQTVQPVGEAPDTRAGRREELELYLANAAVNRRLATLALKPDPGFLDAAMQSDDFLRYAKIGYLSVTCRPEQWERALGVAEAELRRALGFGFTPAELEEQKKTLLTALQERANSASTRESPALANELAESLSNAEVFMHPADELALFEAELRQVTPARMQAALGRLWGGGEPLVFLSGAIKLDQPEATLARAFEASRARPVTPPADNAVQVFAYERFGAPTPIEERRVNEPLGVVQLRFGNQVRVNLKPTRFEANTVLVAARIGGGRLDLPGDKPGLKQLADAAFVSGGLQAHSLDEINRITAAHTVGLGFDVEDEAFVLSGRTTPADLALQLRLMAAYVSAPGYRPEALDRFRQSLPDLYQNLDRTPIGMLQKEVARYVRGGDPRFGYPEEPELRDRTFDELRAALARPLAQGYLELSLVGDFELDAAIDAISATFGSLPARDAAKPAYAQQRQVRFPAGGPLKTFSFETTDPKALAIVYWPTTDFSNVSEVRRLFVLAKVVGNRLLERVRNEQGLTYTAQGDHAPSQAFPGFGFLYALVDAPPAQAGLLSEEIRAIGADLQRAGLSQDELERARNPVVSELKRLLQTNSYLLNAIVSGSQEQPDRLKRATTSVDELQSLRVDDLNAVAKKYLLPERAVPVVIVPRSAVKSGRRIERTRPLALAW